MNNIKIALADIEQALKYLRATSNAFGVTVRIEDLTMTLVTVDAAGHAVEIQLFDMDRSKSKAKVVQTEGLDVLMAAKKAHNG